MVIAAKSCGSKCVTLAGAKLLIVDSHAKSRQILPSREIANENENGNERGLQVCRLEDSAAWMFFSWLNMILDESRHHKVHEGELW